MAAHHVPVECHNGQKIIGSILNFAIEFCDGLVCKVETWFVDEQVEPNLKHVQECQQAHVRVGKVTGLAEHGILEQSEYTQQYFQQHTHGEERIGLAQRTVENSSTASLVVTLTSIVSRVGYKHAKRIKESATRNGVGIPKV